MHVPDGFLDAPTSIGTGVVAVAGVALALRGARRELDDRTAPLVGLVAAFVFAAQMVNFPVGAGTSGHLLGGALAAVLVGPCSAVLCISVVLLVQAFLMADGGVTALGTNITLMGLVGVGVAWLVFCGVRAILPKRPASVVPAAAVAAFVSVPVAATAFTLLFAIGGQASVSVGAVAAAMIGWHTLIGIGEAAVTALVVGAVIAARPDLVYGARPLLEDRLEIRAGQDRTEVGLVNRISRRAVFVALFVAALLIAGGLSYFASSHPDGLEYVAGSQGFLGTAEESLSAGSPFAGYATKGIHNAWLSGAITGVVGVLAVLLVAGGLGLLVRHRGTHTDPRD